MGVSSRQNIIREYNWSIMNTLTMKKKVVELERFIKKASRTLLEFEVAQSKWEARRGIGKIYSSVDALMRDVTKKTKCHCATVLL